MGSAPMKCPMCGEFWKWVKVDETRKGFSVKKAVVGSLLFGDVGLLAGTLGKKGEVYACKKCGFRHEYR